MLKRTFRIFQVAIVISGSVFANLSHAETSPIETFSWDYKSICNSTIPSYVDAYKDGDRELIAISLEGSQSFQALSNGQKKAFLRIVEFFHSMHSDLGMPMDVVKQECLESLEKSINSVSLEDHNYCSDVSVITGDNLRKSGKLKRSGVEVINELKQAAYEMCMKSRVKNEENKNA